MFNLKNVFKSTSKIIEEIHNDFYSEVDKLLASALVENSLETNKQELIAKSERLKALGFTSTKEVTDAKDELWRIKELERDNESKQYLVRAINYFSQKYPIYKFINEKSVKKICKKYNLIYCGIGRYEGNVPEKNLKQIEEFKIEETDNCYTITSYNYNTVSYNNTGYKFYQENRRPKPPKGEPINYNDGKYNMHISELEIVAPLKDFNTNGMEIKDFKLSKLEIPDPVVLKPVYFEGNKYYLIVTAWGIEASDELVVNQRFN